MSQRGVRIIKDKIEDLELLIDGINSRIYYGNGDENHLKQKKAKKLHELEKMKAFLYNILRSQKC